MTPTGHRSDTLLAARCRGRHSPSALRRALAALRVVLGLSLLALLTLSPSRAVASEGEHEALLKPAPLATPTSAAARIRDRQVFLIRAARGGQSAADRAKHATEALERAVEEPAEGAVRVEDQGDVSVVFVGDTPVVQLGSDDAALDGDASVAVHAAVVADKVGEALRAERRRAALAHTVFAFSLLVFSALIAFLSLGKLGSLVARARAWVVSRPSSIPTVRIGGIDVVRPTALRGVALGALDASTWVLRLGLGYLWLLFSLSLFDTTRPYSERLTGLVLAPLSAFVGRVAATMPVLFIGAVAAVVLLLALRVIALFFEGVARGEPTLSWLPADLAGPTSVLLRIGLVLVAASVATPLVTGSEEGPLARASFVAMAAFALAVTPVLASAAVGVTVLFGRPFKAGDFVELGSRAGLVKSVRLLGVTLEDAEGCTVRVPHLAALLHATRVLGVMPPVTVDVMVAASAVGEDVVALLAAAAESVGLRGRVELTGFDADSATYAVTVLSTSRTARGELLAEACKRLQAAGIAPGRSPRAGAA